MLKWVFKLRFFFVSRSDFVQPLNPPTYGEHPQTKDGTKQKTTNTHPSRQCYPRTLDMFFVPLNFQRR
jgi:hypothetical protein